MLTKSQGSGFQSYASEAKCKQIGVEYPKFVLPVDDQEHNCISCAEQGFQTYFIAGECLSETDGPQYTGVDGAFTKTKLATTLFGAFGSRRRFCAKRLLKLYLVTQKLARQH